jgi:hypothetical protein
MKYAAEMGSGGMIYVPFFIKIGCGVQKLLERRYTLHKHRREDILERIFLFL